MEDSEGSEGEDSEGEDSRLRFRLRMMSRSNWLQIRIGCKQLSLNLPPLHLWLTVPAARDLEGSELRVLLPIRGSQTA